LNYYQKKKVKKINLEKKKMKYAKKMYFSTNAEGTKTESFISSFEKDILKIFRNKEVSSEDRIGEYKKIVLKYEYNHY
jgi:hypothetical protein